MTFAIWLAIGGALLVFITLSGSLLSRLPLSTSMLYLLVGLVIGPAGFALAAPEAIAQAALLERLTEVIVLLSLFTSGLKMSAGLNDRRWSPSLRLALISMLATVAMISAAGVLLLGLPIGAAILLGGILAPTDPVLATEVQVSHPDDRDQLRFALTGEGGLNDGTAFPVVMLGLGLLGLHDIGRFGWRWLAIDVLWAAAAGIGIGAALGVSVGKLVIYLRRTHKEAVGHDSFLALGLIGLTYGLSVMAHGYGFLAVFAAGLALRHTERRATVAAATEVGIEPATAAAATAAVVERAHASPDETQAERLATHPRHASAYMAHAVLNFNEQLDHIGEVVGVIAIGMLLWAVPWQLAQWWFAPLVLLAIRPLSVAVGLAGSSTSTPQRRLIAWFGIRGIGSVYYLTYAISHGVSGELAGTLVALTMSVIVASIVVHGLSVTPLMARYRDRRSRRG
jgi:NhaP-type Na+/H+ or K+/H+ antiporter